MKKIIFVFCLLVSVSVAAVTPDSIKLNDTIIWTMTDAPKSEAYCAKVIQLSKDRKYFGVMFVNVQNPIMVWVPASSFKISTLLNNIS